MLPAHYSRRRQNERGQLFTAWIVGIFIIAAMILYVTDAMRRERLSTQNIIYRELALNVARAGFEQAESYFRENPGCCFLPASVSPSSQAWVTPWPAYPDAAFEPGSSNTDFYSSISVACSICTGNTCAGGIIGDVPMEQFVTFTTSEDAQSSQLWGRYVIRRQNTQNWSPGPDTATANTDADACHDLSAIATQSPLGSGARWSIVSRGYILRLPAPITSTAYTTSLLSSPTAFAGNDLLSAPLDYYNNQRFLLGQARVYGEISRLMFNLPDAAVLVPWSTTVTVAAGGWPTLQVNNGYLSIGSLGAAYPFATNITGTTYSLSNESTCTGCIFSESGNQEDPTAYQTTLGAVFPGQTWTSLEATAASLEAGATVEGVTQTSNGSQMVGYTNADDLPVWGNVSDGINDGFNSATGMSYSAQTALPSFYYIGSSLTLTASSNPEYVLSGIGLCVVNGSLTIEGGASNWSGIIYATGQVDLYGATQVNGIIISDTGISIGSASYPGLASVTYSSEMIALVESLLKGFTVDSSSIVATGF